jgi:hypothetical protein
MISASSFAIDFPVRFAGMLPQCQRVDMIEPERRLTILLAQESSHGNLDGRCPVEINTNTKSLWIAFALDSSFGGHGRWIWLGFDKFDLTHYHYY